MCHRGRVLQEKLMHGQKCTAPSSSNGKLARPAKGGSLVCAGWWPRTWHSRLSKPAMRAAMSGGERSMTSAARHTPWKALPAERRMHQPTSFMPPQPTSQ